MLKRRLPIRGGNWNNGSNAGVFALNLNNARTNRNWNIGFRPALICSQMLVAYGLLVSAKLIKRSIVPCLIIKAKIRTAYFGLVGSPNMQNKIVLKGMQDEKKREFARADISIRQYLQGIFKRKKIKKI